MNSSQRDYPSKVLLFGEYSVLLGSNALAHPLTQFSGHPVNLKTPHHTYDLKGLFSYLEAYFSGKQECFLDLEAFKKALKNNWCFDSNIPVGKGLGSSGALCAAIFDHFSSFEGSDEELKKLLGEIESYFHVSSSGIDPIISLKQSGYLIDKDKNLKPVPSVTQNYNELENKGLVVYLVDSGVSRQASPFVKLFKKKVENEDYRNVLIQDYLHVNEHCIQSFLESNASEFCDSIIQLSELQLKLFSEMFLKEIVDHANIIHDQRLGRVKICGAGGGGFYLLFSFIGDEIKKYFPNHELLKLKDYL